MFKTLFLGLILSVPQSLFAAKTYPRYPGIESLQSCDSAQYTPKIGSEFCALAEYVRIHISPLNTPLSVVGSAPVVLLGDTHPNKLLKSWLARNLRAFKAAGFTHVGLEALNSESQDLLDNYKMNPSLRGRVLQLIRDDWNWIPEEHLALIDAIHESGLQLVALDNRNELEKKGLGHSLQLRNEHMAEILQDKLTQSQAGRVVVLTGKVHSETSSLDSQELTLPQVLDQSGIPSLSIHLGSGELLVPSEVTQAFIQLLERHNLPESASGDYYLSMPEGASSHGVIFITR